MKVDTRTSGEDGRKRKEAFDERTWNDEYGPTGWWKEEHGGKCREKERKNKIGGEMNEKNARSQLGNNIENSVYTIIIDPFVESLSKSL